ncbi:MAG TPA: hemerythrin domain-containing protein [Syntrophorhabdaceae bacterium]|nr:hemerythrin domain-containing protein [Syntrophorhabdaceae bacterium]
MKAIQQLKHEHEDVLVALGALEQMYKQLDATGDLVSKAHLEQTLDFLDVYVDQCHHTKEEEVLFPALRDTGFPQESPIKDLLDEHAVSRRQLKKMEEFVSKLGTDDANVIPFIIQNARSYTTLVRNHIDKENNVVFPMANEHLSTNIQDGLCERFENIEQQKVGPGRHESFRALVKKLAEIYL